MPLAFLLLVSLFFSTCDLCKNLHFVQGPKKAFNYQGNATVGKFTVPWEPGTSDPNKIITEYESTWLISLVAKNQCLHRTPHPRLPMYTNSKLIVPRINEEISSPYLITSEYQFPVLNSQGIPR